MDTNQVQVFANLVNYLLSDFWVIALFGFIYFGFVHRKWLTEMAEQGHKKKHNLKDDHELIAVVHGAKTIGLGAILVVASYIIIGLVNFLLPANPAMSEASHANIWLSNSFVIGVSGLIISGYCLILSAGGRWLVYVGKLIATASILFAVAASILTYL